jgi:lipopolysaccharide/colanic/teichoic acid biosynthesis glycosyltransferase
MKTMTFEASQALLIGTRQLERARTYLVLKRALDVLIALILVTLFAPLMVLISLGIRISSPGPILYRQTRIGKNGRLFQMLKFRSMQVANVPDLHREYVQKLIKQNTQPRDMGKRSLKLVGDSRITGLGKYLRKFSLYELPQFINVLRGEMSIVGPRPSLPYEHEVYSEWHKQRLAVLPGITGLWQVSAHNTVAFDEMVRMDISYIQEMNEWLDLKIMLLTPIEMIRARGAG